MSKKDEKKVVNEYGHLHGEKDYAHDEPTGKYLEGELQDSPQTGNKALNGKYLQSKDGIDEYEPQMKLGYEPTLKQYAHGGMVGYAEGGKVGTGDRDTDEKLAKDVLHKMVDDMEGYEAYRIHPNHPEHKGVKNPTENKGENFDEAEPENAENQHDDLDPKVLSDLLNKAGSAHPDGSTKEDMEEELPEEIRSAVAKRKKVSPTMKETR